MESPSTETNIQEPPSSSHKPVLAASKFGSSFGGTDFSKSMAKRRRSSILWPSQLSTVTNNQTANKSILQPAKFQNPFSKLPEKFTQKSESLKQNNKPDGQEDKEDKEKEEEEKSEEKEENNDAMETKSEAKETKSEEKSAEELKPTFLMLGASAKDTVNNTVAPCASEPNFVFGQNLQERVMIANDAENPEKTEREDKKEESTNENGSTELLFSNASAACRPISRPGLTLTEAAHELEEANRANKRKYNQVTPLTGEEGETNVLQVNCKFFAFDKVRINAVIARNFQSTK